jgi:hypothetical protein
MARKWIHSASVEIDDASGALMVRESDGLSAAFQSPILLTQAIAGQATILAADGSKVLYLHELFLKFSATGTIKLESNNTALTGVMAVPACGTLHIRFRADVRGCHRSAAGEALKFTTAGCVATGWAICSKV